MGYPAILERFEGHLLRGGVENQHGKEIPSEGCTGSIQAKLSFALSLRLSASSFSLAKGMSWGVTKHYPAQ